MALRMKRRYDDKTENLLDQYNAQLAFYESHFDKMNQHLTHEEYARARESDPVMTEILIIITQIYEQAIPIALEIIDENGRSFDGLGPH